MRFILKKKILLILLVFGLTAAAFAQGRDRGGNHPRLPAAEPVSLTGTLVVSRGMPALQSDDVTYLLGGINRLVGFVDGLKEGAQITIEGNAMTSPRDDKLKIVRPSKMTLNGKSYDLALPRGNFHPGGKGLMAPHHRWNNNPAPRDWNNNPGPRGWYNNPAPRGWNNNPGPGMPDRNRRQGPRENVW